MANLVIIIKNLNYKGRLRLFDKIINKSCLAGYPYALRLSSATSSLS